jgi:hypothetical protein
MERQPFTPLLHLRSWQARCVMTSTTKEKEKFRSWQARCEVPPRRKKGLGARKLDALCTTSYVRQICKPQFMINKNIVST